MLIDKITERNATVAVIGAGYVGHPLACLFSRAGFRTIAFEIQKERLERIRRGDVDWSDYTPNMGCFTATDDERLLNDTDIFIITVQTPLREDRTPDLSQVEGASRLIKRHLGRDKMVVLESTTYPGTTEEVLKPILEESGLKAGVDFYLAFSPERIDPGSKDRCVENIPKVVGGLTKKCTETASALYSSVICKVVPVSSPRTAEATKLLENVYRNVNIALVNELVPIFNRMGIDTWEVIHAASTKPFGFMPHYPGPGVGGHCIPKDPLYLAYAARKVGMPTEFIELAACKHDRVPSNIVRHTERGLSGKMKTVNGAEIGVLGVTFKKNVPDLRNTPAKTIIEELQKLGAKVTVFDPLVKETFGASAADMEQAVKGKDCILLLVDHDHFREKGVEKLVSKLSPGCVLIDTRNFIQRELLGPEITYSCIGRPSTLSA
jgi:UDP-N-acetyl-D-glucosamine dehydrogenase